MPRGERFWNPYNWVPLSGKPLVRGTPAYHHRWQGLAGRLFCTLEALTPLLVGDGKGQGQFIGRTVAGKRVPFIPGTSLKGAIRSLAELVGNAAVPFPKAHVDPDHQLSEAARESGGSFPNSVWEWQLDVVARTFGYLVPSRDESRKRSRVFAGLVRFSDAHLVGPARPALSFKVAGGAPDPDHRPFYPSNKARKLYHHKTGATELTPPHAGIKDDQKRVAQPLPPGTTFTFVVDFENLGDEEFGLLLYCLLLEEQVTVTLGKEALATGADGPLTLTGPMRHKIGGCKPQGAGSVHVRLDRMELRQDPANRYRAGAASPAVREGEAAREEVARRTRAIVGRTDATMSHLRAMLIYAIDDPRAHDLNYPSYAWFQQDKQEGGRTPLKPVL